jgi:hypothetical protein
MLKNLLLLFLPEHFFSLFVKPQQGRTGEVSPAETKWGHCFRNQDSGACPLQCVSDDRDMQRYEEDRPCPGHSSEGCSVGILVWEHQNREQALLVSTIWGSSDEVRMKPAFSGFRARRKWVWSHKRAIIGLHCHGYRSEQSSVHDDFPFHYWHSFSTSAFGWLWSPSLQSLRISDFLPSFLQETHSFLGDGSGRTLGDLFSLIHSFFHITNN